MAWEDKDELCPTCGAVTKQKKGLTKQNLKKLFSFKFTYDEFLITFMLIVIIVMAFMYKSETQQCRDWLKPLHAGTLEECKNVCDTKCELIRATEYTNFDANELKNITNISNGFNVGTP